MMIIWPARSRKQNMCREVSLTGKRLLRFLPILLVLASALGLLGIQLAQPVADAFTFCLTLPMSIWECGRLRKKNQAPEGA